METHRLILVTNVILRLVQVHFQFFAPLRLCEKFSFSLFYSFTLLAPLSRKAGLSEAKQKNHLSNNHFRFPVENHFHFNIGMKTIHNGAGIGSAFQDSFLFFIYLQCIREMKC